MISTISPAVNEIIWERKDGINLIFILILGNVAAPVSNSIENNQVHHLQGSSQGSFNFSWSKGGGIKR